jgi:hypothetical protein
VDALTFLKASKNWTFCERIGRAVFSGMVLQGVHVPGKQLPGIAVPKHARSRSVGEKTSTFCIAAENPLGCGIEYQVNALLNTLEGVFGLHSHRFVFV